MKFLTSFYILLALSICPSTLSAEDEERVNVTLCAITVEGNINDIKYESGGEVRPLNILRQLRSEYFKYTGSQVITFFKESGTGDEATRTPIGQCRLPAASGDYILAFSKVDDPKERYNIIAIPDSLSNFKPGTYRFINLAPFQVALKLDETIHQIKENNFTDVVGNKTEKSHRLAIMVSLPKDEEPLRVFKGKFANTPNQRIICLLTPKEGGRPGRIKITLIPERIEVTEN